MPHEWWSFLPPPLSLSSFFGLGWPPQTGGRSDLIILEEERWVGILPEIGQRYLILNKLLLEEVTWVFQWLLGRNHGSEALPGLPAKLP